MGKPMIIHTRVDPSYRTLSISNMNGRITLVRDKMDHTEHKNLLHADQTTPNSPVWKGPQFPKIGRDILTNATRGGTWNLYLWLELTIPTLKITSDRETWPWLLNLSGSSPPPAETNNCNSASGSTWATAKTEKQRATAQNKFKYGQNSLLNERGKEWKT